MTVKMTAKAEHDLFPSVEHREHQRFKGFKEYRRRGCRS